MYVKHAALALLLACHSSSPSVSPGSGAGEPSARGEAPPQQNEAPASGNHLPPPPTPDPSAGSATGSSAYGSAAGPGIGEPCGPADRCAAGLSCVHYFGIAGPRGPEFKSCELRCKDSSVCPQGTSCITISDGPGQVCRVP